ERGVIMAGYLLLAGGAEFGGRMAEADLRAIELAGGDDARISIIPTAAAPDNNHDRAGRNGVRWFESLGARRVAALPLIDRASAESPAIAATLRESRLIYLLGGFPHYLGQTLLGSASWQAVVAAHQAGAVVAGSSAGAMVLCQHYYQPDAKQVAQGLAVLPNACVLPHHNTFGRSWAAQLAALLPGSTLIGIDERTAMLNDADGAWQVYGQGAVTLYRDHQPTAYRSGKQFEIGD
ncbi:MAG TPA: Type 1 glutamine amidotransferase-like domain-containing protein, partial [Roseiflexaceae bacterium]|nr:Type 1 glutamine amidotransferase-like domain-containing protein [Roseiflexaceae bacterium]